MFLLPVPFSDAALQTVMVAGEQLDPTDQLWFSAQISILERPHVGSDQEAQIRVKLIMDELITAFDTRAAQYPSQEREWKVFGRMLLYIRALIQKDAEKTAFYENEFMADLAYYKSLNKPS